MTAICLWLTLERSHPRRSQDAPDLSGSRLFNKSTSRNSDIICNFFCSRMPSLEVSWTTNEKGEGRWGAHRLSKPLRKEKGWEVEGDEVGFGVRRQSGWKERCDHTPSPVEHGLQPRWGYAGLWRKGPLCARVRNSRVRSKKLHLPIQTKYPGWYFYRQTFRHTGPWKTLHPFSAFCFSMQMDFIGILCGGT